MLLLAQSFYRLKQRCLSGGIKSGNNTRDGQRTDGDSGGHRHQTRRIESRRLGKLGQSAH